MGAFARPAQRSKPPLRSGWRHWSITEPALERAAAAAAKSSAGEPAASSTASAKSRPARTRARGRDKNLVHIASPCCASNSKRRIGLKPSPTYPPGPTYQLRRIFHDPGKRLRPVVLHAQSHRIGQKFFERGRRHQFQPLAIHAIHELLEAEHRDPRPRSLHRLGRHHARKQPPDQNRERHAHDQQQH